MDQTAGEPLPGLAEENGLAVGERHQLPHLWRTGPEEQAAGFAYAWKKMKHLDGIDAFQWHNWMDGRGEFGLRIGLRKYPDDENDPAGKSRYGTSIRQPTLHRKIKF